MGINPEIAVGEKVIIEYTLAVTDGIEEGKYINTAKAEGEDDQGNPISSNEAQSTVEVRGGIILAAVTPEGSVLGAALPLTGGDNWMLILAAFCLLLAGMLLRNYSLVNLYSPGLWGKAYRRSRLLDRLSGRKFWA